MDLECSVARSKKKRAAGRRGQVPVTKHVGMEIRDGYPITVEYEYGDDFLSVGDTYTRSKLRRLFFPTRG
jgi:hypothetical protein